MMCISLFFSSYILIYSEPEWYLWWINLITRYRWWINLITRYPWWISLINSTRSRSFVEDPPSNFSCGGCLPHYRPNREISIDEAMIAFKGRSLMKQYLPKKPIKRGFTVWVRADSHNAYISQFECYTGKKGDTAEVGLGGNVVIRLTRDLVGKNYNIYMDNFFSSVSLYKSLLLDKIYSTGTLHSNRRYFPPELKTISEKGDGKEGGLG